MRLLAALAVAAALAGAAAASPPQRGLVVPGTSLGGVRLGQTKAQVTAAWGASHGVCSGCRALTWYFTYASFKPEGAAVEFRAGKVSALWTLWSPAGWRTSAGLHIGDDQARITELYGVLVPTTCSGYSTFTLSQHGAQTSIYVVDDKVWGFGLSRAGAPACR